MILGLETTFGRRWTDAWAHIEREAMLNQWGAVLYGLGSDEIHKGLIRYSCDRELQKYVPTAAEFRHVARPNRPEYMRDPPPPRPRRKLLTSHSSALQGAYNKLRALADNYQPPETLPPGVTAVAHRQLHIMRQLAAMRKSHGPGSKPVGYLTRDETLALYQHLRTR